MSLRGRASILAGIALILALGSCGGGSQADNTPTNTATVSPSPTKGATPRRAGTYIVSSTQCLNLRQSPTTGAQVVTCMPPGSSVRADGATKKADGYTWYHVTYKAMTGWAASQYLARKTAS